MTAVVGVVFGLALVSSEWGHERPRGLATGSGRGTATPFVVGTGTPPPRGDLATDRPDHAAAVIRDGTIVAVCPPMETVRACARLFVAMGGDTWPPPRHPAPIKAGPTLVVITASDLADRCPPRPPRPGAFPC